MEIALDKTDDRGVDYSLLDYDIYLRLYNPEYPVEIKLQLDLNVLAEWRRNLRANGYIRRSTTTES